jgi:hypothetical protein
MKRETKMQTITIAALLSALGIVIAMFMPKIVIPPFSMTLAVHVPVFIALFISPPVAVAVSLVSAVGFLFAGLPPVIALRAVSHVVFALTGALILKKRPDAMATVGRSVGFGLLMALIHAVCEVAAVTLFYLGTDISMLSMANGFAYSVLLLVGGGTIVHSMIDFGIAIFVWKPLVHVINIPVSLKITPSFRREVRS